MTRHSFLSRAGASLSAVAVAANRLPRRATVLLGACTLLSAAALGQTLPGARAWADREQLLAHFERVAEVDLKALYLRCAHESNQRLLDFEEAARCSITGEVLKARSFGGDFNALLAWWRLHRNEHLGDLSEGNPLAWEIERQRQ